MSEDPKSLRDEFAMAGMGAAISVCELENRFTTPDNIAAWAYAIADAMMAERSKSTPTQVGRAG